METNDPWLFASSLHLVATFLGTLFRVTTWVAQWDLPESSAAATVDAASADADPA